MGNPSTPTWAQIVKIDELVFAKLELGCIDRKGVLCTAKKKLFFACTSFPTRLRASRYLPTNVRTDQTRTTSTLTSVEFVRVPPCVHAKKKKRIITLLVDRLCCSLHIKCAACQFSRSLRIPLTETSLPAAQCLAFPHIGSRLQE